MKYSSIAEIKIIVQLCFFLIVQSNIRNNKNFYYSLKNISMKFSLKYEWVNVDNWMDIKDFWESLLGFWELSKEIFKVGKIKTDVDVKITSVRKGSIIVDIALSLTDYINSFSSFEDFLYFIEITNRELFIEITSKLETISNESVNKINTLEQWAKENPIKWWVIGACVYDLIKTTLLVVKDYKIKWRKVENIWDKEDIDIGSWKMIKWETLKSIKVLVDKWKSVHFLEPIIEDKVNKIKIWKDSEYIEINNDNFEYFIWEWNEILPELKNWWKYEFRWSFTAMQSNRWETITFLSNHFKNNNNQAFQFSCYLVDGKTTEDYSDFYWASKSLKLQAEVIRVSNYKKPKLKILDVELHQTSLNLET